MTKQIGKAYRRNRKGSWLLIAFIIAIAAVAIPMASGHNTTSQPGVISGTVWQDTNDDGLRGDAVLEPAQANIEVNLYTRLYIGTKFIGFGLPRQTHSNSSGTYTFTNLPLGVEYLVCERITPLSDWSQTTPLVPTLPCGTIPYNKPNGHVVKPSVATPNPGPRDFGNVKTTPLPAGTGCSTANLSGTNVTSGFQYKARLSVQDDNHCKTGSLVMVTYQAGDKRVATLHPPSDVTGTKYPVIEWFRWTGLSGTLQNPITLSYDDIAPYDGLDTGLAGNDGARVMPMCKVDPRLSSSDPFALDPSLTDAMILPSVGDPNDQPVTSCMILSTDGAGGMYEAYVYSKVDGWKGGRLSL